MRHLSSSASRCRPRPEGSTEITLAAHAPREDVIFDTGTSNTLHVANGVGWYFNAEWSWGFAPEGASVQRGSCDTAGSSDPDRLCWHTFSGGNIGFGYRCGNHFLNHDSSWERLVYQH